MRTRVERTESETKRYNEMVSLVNNTDMTIGSYIRVYVPSKRYDFRYRIEKADSYYSNQGYPLQICHFGGILPCYEGERTIEDAVATVRRRVNSFLEEKFQYARNFVVRVSVFDGTTQHIA